MEDFQSYISNYKRTVSIAGAVKWKGSSGAFDGQHYYKDPVALVPVASRSNHRTSMAFDHLVNFDNMKYSIPYGITSKTEKLDTRQVFKNWSVTFSGTWAYDDSTEFMRYTFSIPHTLDSVRSGAVYQFDIVVVFYVQSQLEMRSGMYVYHPSDPTLEFNVNTFLDWDKTSPVNMVVARLSGSLLIPMTYKKSTLDIHCEIEAIYKDLGKIFGDGGGR